VLENEDVGDYSWLASRGGGGGAQDLEIAAALG
jgi:hypothetical protein